MGLYLVVIEGKNRGERFEIKEGLTLGRSKADLSLNDPKVSSVHARIVKSKSGGFRIIDNKSTNGLKFEGKKVKSKSLKSGVIIQVGQSFLRVEDEAMGGPVELDDLTPSAPAEGSKKKDKSAASHSKKTPTKDPQPKGNNHSGVVDIGAFEPEGEEEAIEIQTNQAATPETEAEPEPPKWFESLAEFVEKVKKKIKNRPKKVEAMNPPLRLKFQRGIQVDTVWTLGYGPRDCGRRSIDLPIFEPMAPDRCFSIVPAKTGNVFHTDHPNIVKLNDKEVKDQPLKDGDRIQILGTEIAIEHLQDQELDDL